MASLEHVRHSLAHLLATAAVEWDPKAKLGIGPVIDTGFYYDIEFSKPLSIEDLPTLESRMRELVGENLPFERIDATAAQAREQFQDQPYKLELIDELEEKGEAISLYQTGAFIDLCRGGHVEKTGEIKGDAFKLSHVAGAYWRGSENNKQLTRIYGLAFDTKEELDAYTSQQEEAKKRDHRILGAQLKLFTLSPLVGSGLPLLQPNGTIIRKEIENYLWSLHAKKGYAQVWTPHLAKEDLYTTSGHAAKFGDELFRVAGKEEKFFMKPMNCPHHMQIFADNHFSYRDMPVRYFEPATVYRDEKTGQLGGLTRVRAITQDDGHLFCRISQINEEVSTVVSIIKEFFTTMGMIDGYWVRLSVRGPEGQYLGSDEIWNTAERALEDAAKSNDLPYRRVEGEAAFYGPKLDFIFKDAIGREWQLSTIQCDFNLPERFELSYVNEHGEKEQPVVIHRAISGSLERFMGVMIEHFAGAFPLWLSPIHARILPVSEKHQEYANQVYAQMIDAGLRTQVDNSNESLGKRIREAKMQKIPYLLVVGEKEIEAGTVTLESRDKGNMGANPVSATIEKLQEEIKIRAR